MSVKDAKSKKCIGLLLCTLSCGDVYVFSMPLVSMNSSSSSVMYDSVDVSIWCRRSTGLQITCVQWSRAFPYDKLIAGTGNGTIAIWDVRYLQGDNPPCQVLAPSSEDVSHFPCVILYE